MAYGLAEVLKPVHPLFLEEAIRPENMDSMAELRRRVQIPIATGEELYTKFQFQQLLTLGGADNYTGTTTVSNGTRQREGR